MKPYRFDSHSMQHVNHIFCSDITGCPACVGTATQTTNRCIYCPDPQLLTIKNFTLQCPKPHSHQQNKMFSETKFN